MSCVNSSLRWKIPRYCGSDGARGFRNETFRMKHFLVAMLALALAACGSKGEDEATPAASTAGSRPVAVGNDSVAAVLESQGTPAAQLRFLIETRPVAGKQFGLQLIASASEPVPQLLVAIESDQLRFDAASIELDLSQESDAGTARTYSASHDLLASAREEGLAEVTVRLRADADSPEAVYVFPVLVARPEPGEATQATASDKPDPAPEADNGQP